MEKDEKPTLMVHEWLAIATIIGMLGMLTIISIKGAPPTLSTDTEIIQTSTNISVTITGAIEHPGTYQLPKEATLKELIAQAKPLPMANLAKINPDKILKHAQTIHIPQIEMITIHIHGAVKKQDSLQLPKGTRLADLLTLVEFEPEANLKPLNKKRRLKDQEIIKIKTKSSHEALPNTIVRGFEKKNNET